MENDESDDASQNSTNWKNGKSENRSDVILTENSGEESSSKWPSFNLSWVVSVVSLGSGFNFGYQLLITNPAEEAFIQFLNDCFLKMATKKTEEELESFWIFIVSLLFWGATVGAFLIQSIADRLGRKRGMILSFVVQLLAIFMAISSYFLVSWTLYAASRVILGAATSVSLGIAALFVTECSPTACRGIVSSAIGILVQLGVLVGSIAAMPRLLGTRDRWWLLYVGEGLLTMIVTICCFFITETPGYLLMCEQSAKAVSSLKYYQEISDEEAEKIVSLRKTTYHNQRSLGIFQLCSDRASLRGTVVGCFVVGAMIMSGISAINAFAYGMLLSTGLSSFDASIGNVVICGMNVIGNLCSAASLTAFGRRPLLIFSFAFLAANNVLICGFMWGFEMTGNTTIGWFLVASICVFNFVFCVGLGPVSFIITGELVGQHARAAAYTWANIVMSGIPSALFFWYLPLKNSLGGPLSHFLLFFPPCAIATVVLFFYLPESKGRTPEETQEAIKDLPSPLRKREMDDFE